MRDIKFRAWNKKYKEMYYPKDMRLTFTSVVNKGFDVSVIKNESSVNFVSEILELMQYTGLKDKNGKEIYEGDILMGNNAVRWDKNLLQWETSDGLMLWAYRKDWLEIIGNIYETPELLS